MSGLKLNRSKLDTNDKASSFTQGAPVQTTVASPVIEEEIKAEEPQVEQPAVKEKEQPKKRSAEPKLAPWRQGVNIDPKDLKLIQRPFNNNISQENYMRLVWLKGLGSIGFGANKDTFASMLDEALTEYTARRIKAHGDNYDI